MKSNRLNNRLFCAAAMCAFTVLGLNPSANADIYRVDIKSGSTSGDGSDWGSDAFKYLQDALDVADDGDQVWVAAGTYYVDRDNANHPYGSGQRDATFLLEDGVKLRGGFAGDEANYTNRALDGNTTILSGELYKLPDGCGLYGESDAVCCAIVCGLDPGCCDYKWDELCATVAAQLCGGAYHVVTAESEIDDPLETFIERFTIQDGVANGPGDDEYHGAGILVFGEPGIIRCEITKNVASDKGNGISIQGEGISPIIVNCVFHENPIAETEVVIGVGGGLANFGGNVKIINSLFYDNIVPGNGGAIHNEIGTCGENPPSPCGGVIDLINCTIVDNEAGNDGTGWGGGVFNTQGAYIDADNCIFYFNTDDDGSEESSQITVHGVVDTVDYSDVQGDWSGAGDHNIYDNPLFIAGAGNYRLGLGSPCIEAGDNSAVECDLYNINNDAYDCDSNPVGDNPDLDLNDRIRDTNVEMGTYEYETCIWDLNDDCVVDIMDLAELLTQVGRTGRVWTC